ncbi:Homeobox protein Dlx3b [Thelohanellus kitauei]|uniref:Homeobox protein Dlx3b n=1 Tax=Thelohanellus kitauei TaxID=669202 RepID=A0A0C2N8Y5_THEKT|nr:Homeobox protein Dlx3b [Thelohanellus kitauei]
MRSNSYIGTNLDPRYLAKRPYMPYMYDLTNHPNSRLVLGTSTLQDPKIRSNRPPFDTRHVKDNQNNYPPVSYPTLIEISSRVLHTNTDPNSRVSHNSDPQNYAPRHIGAPPNRHFQNIEPSPNNPHGTEPVNYASSGTGDTNRTIHNLEASGSLSHGAEASDYVSSGIEASSRAVQGLEISSTSGPGEESANYVSSGIGGSRRSRKSPNKSNGESPLTPRRSPRVGRASRRSNNSFSMETCDQSNDNLMDTYRTRRRPRTVFSRYQLCRMKAAFLSKPYLTSDERKNLARDLKITCEQIKVWFQNHRSKLKRIGKPVANNNNPNDYMGFPNPFPPQQMMPYPPMPGINMNQGQIPPMLQNNQMYRSIPYPQPDNNEFVGSQMYQMNEMYGNPIGGMYQNPVPMNQMPPDPNINPYPQYPSQGNRNPNHYLVNNQYVFANRPPSTTQTTVTIPNPQVKFSYATNLCYYNQQNQDTPRTTSI